MIKYATKKTQIINLTKLTHNPVFYASQVVQHEKCIENILFTYSFIY